MVTVCPPMVAEGVMVTSAALVLKMHSENTNMTARIRDMTFFM